MADVTAAPGDAAARKSCEDGVSADEHHKLPPALIGMSTGLKHLYAGKEDIIGRFEWQTTIPHDLGEPAENAETAKWALILRHVKVYSDPSKVLAMHSILIQSPLLKEFLTPVLKGYPGVTVGLKQLEIGNRFEPLIHRWVELNAALDNLEKEGNFEPLSEEEVKKKQNEIDPMLRPLRKTDDEAGTGSNNADKTAEPVESKASDATTKATSANPARDGITTPAVVDESAEETPTPKRPTGNCASHDKTDATSHAVSIARSIRDTGSHVDKLLQPAESLADSRDTVKLRHAKLLVDVLTTEFSSLIESSRDMRSQGVMTFEYLWTLFQPGCLVYCRQEGQDRVFRLVHSKYGEDPSGRPCFMLTLCYVDFDGIRFGTAKIATAIESYAGTKSIVSLTASPLECHDNRDSLRASLIERGAKVEDLSGTRYVAYNGLGWRYTERSRKAFTVVKGRVVIDTLGWNKESDSRISVVPFKFKSEDEADDFRELSPNAPVAGRFQSYSKLDIDDSSDSDDDFGVPIDGNAQTAADQLQAAPLDEEQKLICTHLLRGYALREKRWLNIYANSVHEIEFDARAFDALVLPELQKELILGFTTTQELWRRSFDDVISGKGRGIIMLLSGPPGVGKTLTAESVAEEMKVPLYVLSAGELGHDASMLEARLSLVFDMVTRWNAVLLLDESEIFLEERSLANLERNKLVCTFLRVLEYYEGIMFMTTNRVRNIDTAFLSRIHISLDYPELTTESRRRIWKNFLDQHNVTQEALRTKSLTVASQSCSRTVVAWKPKGSVASGSKNTDDEAKELAKTDVVDGWTQSPVLKSSPATTNDGHINSNVPTADRSLEPLTEEDIDAHERRTRPHILSRADINDLAKLQLNGRQIRNILKSSQLLANRKLEALTKGHITTVLEVTQHFHNSTVASDRVRGAIFN